MSDNSVNLSLRLKNDKLILKLGDAVKELTIGYNCMNDEVTQLIKLLHERRQEVLDKRRRDMLESIRNSRKD